MAEEAQAKQQPKYEHQFREIPRLSLWTDTPGIDKEDKSIKFKRSRLSWSSFMGNPRITVNTNVPNDTDKGMIRAPMDISIFNMLKTMAEEVMRGEPGTVRRIENYTRDKDADGKYGEKYKLSETVIGKDKEGRMVLSVQAPDRPVIYFHFTVSDYHKLLKGNGEAFTMSEASVLKARADFDTLKEIFIIHAKEAADKEMETPRTPNARFKKPETKNDFSDLDDITF